MERVFCPECEQLLNLGNNPFKGQKVACSNCHARLVVSKLDRGNIELSLDTSARRKPRVIDIDCPECESVIKVSINAREGQPLSCPECHASLEVVSIDPIEIDVAIPVSLKRNRQRKQGKQSDRLRRD